MACSGHLCAFLGMSVIGGRLGFRLKKNSHTLKQREGVRWGGGEQPVPEGSKDRLGTGSLWLRGGEGRLTAWLTAWEGPEAAVSDIWAGLVLIPAFWPETSGF